MYSFTKHVDSLVIHCHYQFLSCGLPEAVRNCILGYACCVDLFTVLDFTLRLCIYNNMLIYGSIKARQTYLILPYSNVLKTP